MSLPQSYNFVYDGKNHTNDIITILNNAFITFGVRFTPEESTHTPEESTPSPEKQHEEEPQKGLSGGAVAGIVVGSTAVVGTGGFLLFWFVIKKKSWAEMLAVFQK